MGIVNRRGRRVRASVRVAFVGLHHELDGEVQTLDLSFSGCRGTCPSPPPVGTKLQMSVYLPGEESSRSIELAVVRWARKGLIGIQFCSIPSPHREQLHAWIMRAPYGRSQEGRVKPYFMAA